MKIVQCIVVFVVFASFLVTTKALICYECQNAPSNEACNAGFNGGLRNCPSNALSCENLVRTRDGETLYFKQCKQPEACRNNLKGNNNGPQCRPGHPIHSECWCCCEGEDLCNAAALPCLGPGPSTEQAPSPTPPLVTCPEPGSQENGRTTCISEPLPDGTYLLTSRCTYECNEGYTLIGSSTTTCDYVDGSTTVARFQPPPPVCRRNRCDYLEEIENGFVDCPNGNRVGSACEFSCVEGYSLFPPDITETECLINLTWSNSNPCCLEDCSPDALVDLVIVLDSSSSIGRVNWGVMLQFTTAFISNLNVRPDAANIGVFRYNKRVDQRSRIYLSDFENDRAGLINAVERVPYNGAGTLTGNALRYARNTMFRSRNGDRPDAANVILVITDGRAQDDELVFSQSARLRSEGVITYAIGIRAAANALDFRQLNAIAGSPDQLIILERGFEGLSESLASSLGKNICQPRECPGARLTTRREPTPTPPPPSCAPPRIPENGRAECAEEAFLNGRFLLRSRCYFACNEGYTLIGSSTTTCNVVDGSTTVARFQPPPPVCRSNRCDSLEEIDNGFVDCPNGNRVGAVCEFSCVDGHSLFPPDSTETECLVTRSWSNPNPCCLEDCTPHPIDFVIILDSSSSIGKANWRLMLQFVTNFVSKLNIAPTAVNVGVFRYNSKIDRESRIFLRDFANDREGLIRAVEKIPYNGQGTLTGNALRYARTTIFQRRNGDRPEASNVILVITDGRAQDDDLVFSESEDLRNEGVITYVIGVRSYDDSLDSQQLFAIAGSKDQLMVLDRGFEELRESLAAPFGPNNCAPRSCPGIIR